MKRTTVFKAVIVIALILGAVFVSGCIEKIESKLNIGRPALKLTISTGVNESDGSPIVTNLTFEQTQVIYKGADAKVEFPEISVMVRNQSIDSAPVTYWAAQPWVEGNEKYTLTLTFRESFTPKTNDLLILTIRFTDFEGHIIGKNTAFYEWK